MLTRFTGEFASKGINVSGMVSKSRGDWAYTILDTDRADEDIVKAIESIEGVVKVRLIK